MVDSSEVPAMTQLALVGDLSVRNSIFHTPKYQGSARPATLSVDRLLLIYAVLSCLNLYLIRVDPVAVLLCPLPCCKQPIRILNLRIVELRP